MIIIVPTAAIPVLAALVLALVVANLVFLAVESAAIEVEVRDAHDDLVVVHEERDALRILRVRYARGEISVEAYRQLTFELEPARPS